MNNINNRNKITADTVSEDSEDSTLLRNIRACGAVSDIVRSTLGPNGSSKLLVDQTFDITGEYVVTNDGGTILEEVPIEDSTAELITAAARSQNETHADGATTVAVLAGALLREGADLHESGLHPTTVIAGYESARQQIRKTLESIAVDVTDEDDFRDVISTAIGGNVEAAERTKLTEITYGAFSRVGRNEFNNDTIKITTIAGGSIGDSGILDGVALDKEPVHSRMPSAVRDATVALVDGSIQSREWDDMNAEISAFEQYQSYSGWEDETVDEAVDAVLEADVDVLFLSSHLDDRVQVMLADADVLAVRHVDPADLRLLGNATGASPVTAAANITPRETGVADRVAERRIGTQSRLLIERTADTETATIVLRAGTEQVLDELERTVEGAVKSLQTVTEDSRAVWGGGATEAELGWHLRRHASNSGSREQLAIRAVADALESIPTALATNAGADPIDRIVELRNEHDIGKIDRGVAQSGTVDSMREQGVMEPFQTKRSAIEIAFDIATRILRIDALIATEPLTQAEEEEAVERIEMNEDIDEAIKNVRKT